MANLSDVSLCTYNCRSIKNSLFDVQKLCVKYDIIFLQEHWLLPCELNTLSNIDTEFLAFGVSAVDISSNVLRGKALLCCIVNSLPRLWKLLTVRILVYALLL